jgi:hypothetical protein
MKDLSLWFSEDTSWARCGAMRLITAAASSTRSMSCSSSNEWWGVPVNSRESYTQTQQPKGNYP